MMDEASPLTLGLPPKRADYNRAEEVQSLLQSVTGLAHDFVAQADDDADALASGHGLQVSGGAPRTVLVERHAPEKLRSLLNLSVSASGRSAEAEPEQDFVEHAKHIMSLSVNTSSPGFMDKLYSSPSPPGLAADLLLSTLNTNAHVFGCSPALTLIEKYVGVQLAALFGLSKHSGPGDKGAASDPNAGGVTVPGGAAANTTAMLVARNVRFPAVKEQGIIALPGRLAVFASEDAHYSAVTGAQQLGLGSRSVHKVKTLPSGAMDPDALHSEINSAVADGEIPFFVIATAGTTVRGAYDDVEKIERIGRPHGVWLHIDACWGGGAIFSEKLRHKLKGSHLADSIAFNPHKMLGVPLTTSFLLGRDLRTFWAANRLEAGYLFHGDEEQAQVSAAIANDSSSAKGDSKGNTVSGSQTAARDRNDNWRTSAWVKAAPNADTVFDLAQFVPQCGRRPDALKLYMHWRFYGTEGIARHVEASFAGAREVLRLVRDSPVLAAVGGKDDNKNGEPPCAQACFYYCGKGGRLGMQKRITRAIVERLAQRGWMTDYAPGETKDQEYLRVVCNRLTTGRVAAGLVKAVIESGQQIERELSL